MGLSNLAIKNPGLQTFKTVDTRVNKTIAELKAAAAENRKTITDQKDVSKLLTIKQVNLTETEKEAINIIFDMLKDLDIFNQIIIKLEEQIIQFKTYYNNTICAIMIYEMF